MITHGTTTLTTPRLTLRRYIPEAAPILYTDFGLDSEMSRYSGWNPYATPEMAEETVKSIIGSYAGTFISYLLNIELLGKGYFTNFVFCVVGAVAVLWIWKKLFD